MKLIEKIKMKIDAIGAQGVLLIIMGLITSALLLASLYIFYKIIAWIL